MEVQSWICYFQVAMLDSMQMIQIPVQHVLLEPTWIPSIQIGRNVTIVLVSTIKKGESCVRK